MKTQLLSILFIIISAPSYAGHCDRPASHREFIYIQNSLKPSRSDQFRKDQVIQLIHNHCFTSSQMQSLMAFVLSDDSRISIGQAAFVRVFDPENFYRVYDSFNAFSMAFRLHDMVHQQMLQQCAPIPPPVIIEDPVIICEPTPAQFNQISNSIRNQSFASDKLEMARVIIRDYCFTVGQIRGLMNNFHFSSGKLEMAKLAYDTCIDPHNYYQLIDALTFPSEKEELRQYISSRR